MVYVSGMYWPELTPDISLTNLNIAYSKSPFLFLIFFLITAAYEEMFFRYIPIQLMILVQANGKLFVIVVLCASALFGYMHDYALWNLFLHGVVGIFLSIQFLVVAHLFDGNASVGVVSTTLTHAFANLVALGLNLP